jgi:hypothetical protein
LAKEDYNQAAILRDKIDELTREDPVMQLQQRLKQAIADESYKVHLDSWQCPAFGQQLLIAGRGRAASCQASWYIHFLASRAYLACDWEQVQVAAEWC